MPNLTSTDPIEKFQNIFHLYLKDNPTSTNDQNKSLRFGKLLLILKNVFNVSRREFISNMFFSKIIKKISMEHLVEDILKNRISNYMDLLNLLNIDLTSTNYFNDSLATATVDNNQVNVCSKSPRISSFFSSNFSSFNPFFVSQKINFF